MQKLQFLGKGSAFNFNYLNTAAYLEFNDSILFFDMGESIFNQILKHNLLKDKKHIYILITHTHSDHIGSLEPCIYYLHFFMDVDYHVYYPKTKNLHRLIELTGADFPFEIEPVPEQIEDVRIETVVQKHIAGSYGYFVYSKEQNFFFSGDAYKVNRNAIRKLKNNEIDVIYHEFSNKNSPIHTSVEQLEKCFSKKYRTRVYLMHANSKEEEDLVASKGFQVVRCIDEQ